MKKALLLITLLAFTFSAFAQNITFEAKGLLFLLDADMSAFTIIDGELRKTPETADQISTLTFPLSYGNAEQIKSDKASNSVLNGGKNITITSDQKLAYVLETKGETAYNQSAFSDMAIDFPSGKYVTVVNIENLKEPKSLYRFPVGENPKSIALGPKNQYLAVSSEEYGKELQVFELDGSGKPQRIIKKPQNMSPGRLVELTWHSSGNYIAYINQDEATVGLIKVLRDAITKQIIRLDLMGEPVHIGGKPSVGKFTPDGKHYLILDKKKDQTDQEEGAKGEVFVLKFNLESEGSNHFLLSRAPVGENPMGFAIHPDGSHLIVSNLERSFFPPENYSASGESSISVLHLDFDGTLENIKNYKIDGILPASVVFDKTGKNISFSVYQYLTFGFSFGGIEFLKFDPTSTDIITAQRGKIYVPRGVHSLKVIREF